MMQKTLSRAIARCSSLRRRIASAFFLSHNQKLSVEIAPDSSMGARKTEAENEPDPVLAISLESAAESTHPVSMSHEFSGDVSDLTEMVLTLPAVTSQLVENRPDSPRLLSANAGVSSNSNGLASSLAWPFPLMDYQVAGVNVLLSNPRLLLADDMGLGKTVQSIAAVRVLFAKREIEKVLVVVPASLLDQWRREFAVWAPEVKILPIRGSSHDRLWQWNAATNVTIASYETLRADFHSMRPESRLRQKWDLVIIDEAQKIKNRESDVSRTVKKLQRERSWAMTGTPLENSLDDLASVLEFVDHNDDGSTKTYSVSHHLLERLQVLQLRRKKSDVLKDLPLKRIIRVDLDLLPRQERAYRRAEEEGMVQLRAHGSAIRITHILELITRLKQICNRDPVSGESSKLVDIHDRLEVLVAEGHRALVFSQYTDLDVGTAAVADYLARFSPLVFDGSLSSHERDDVVQEFKRNPQRKALILSLRAGGVGLNLQEASYVFHFDRWWNPAVERQAEDRSHRMGQLYPVTVIKYSCRGTIEERIDQILSQKQQLFDDLVDDVSLDLTQRLTRDDLFGLFGLEYSETR